MQILSEATHRLEQAILALEPDEGHPHGGTMFLFNHLLPPTGTGEPVDRVVTFLVTSAEAASGGLGRLTMARHMVDAPDAAEVLLFRDWSDQWLRPTDPNADVAVLPFAHLDNHAARKGWNWTTQEVTDGMLLKPADRVAVLPGELAVYGYEPSQLGSAAQRPSVRPVGIESLPNGSVGVVGAPASFTGAPVIALAELPDGYARFVVAGLVGSSTHADPAAPRPLVPASLIRTAAAQVADRLLGPE